MQSINDTSTSFMNTQSPKELIHLTLQKEYFVKYINALRELLFCVFCRQSFRTFYDSNSLEARLAAAAAAAKLTSSDNESGDTLVKWSHDAHEFVNEKEQHLPFPLQLYHEIYIQPEIQNGWDQSTISKRYAFAFYAQLYIGALNYPVDLNISEPRHKEVVNYFNQMIQVYHYTIPWKAPRFAKAFKLGLQRLTQQWKQYFTETNSLLTASNATPLRYNALLPANCKCQSNSKMFHNKNGWRPSQWGMGVVWFKLHVDAWDGDHYSQEKTMSSHHNLVFDSTISYYFRSRFDVFHFIYELELFTTQHLVQNQVNQPNRLYSAFGNSCTHVGAYFDCTFRSQATKRKQIS